MKYMMRQERSEECIFCKAAVEEATVENLVVLRRKSAFVILNRFPYTTGHIMIVPYVHVDTIEALDSATRGEMMDLMAEMMILLRELYHPQAFNIGANIGMEAGAGIAGHVHLHVVPRWAGDTNFMSTIGETRVLPEELVDTFQRIHDRLK
jgi:ATP adenylyltransferase